MHSFLITSLILSISFYDNTPIIYFFGISNSGILGVHESEDSSSRRSHVACCFSSHFLPSRARLTLRTNVNTGLFYHVKKNLLRRFSLFLSILFPNGCLVNNFALNHFITFCRTVKSKVRSNLKMAGSIAKTFSRRFIGQRHFTNNMLASHFSISAPICSPSLSGESAF